MGVVNHKGLQALALGSVRAPETPISLHFGILLKSYQGSHYRNLNQGILLHFKVYSLIWGYFDIGVSGNQAVR